MHKDPHDKRSYEPGYIPLESADGLLSAVFFAFLIAYVIGSIIDAIADWLDAIDREMKHLGLAMIVTVGVLAVVILGWILRRIQNGRP